MSGSLTWRTLHTPGCSRRSWSWCHPHTWAHYHDNADTMTIINHSPGHGCGVCAGQPGVWAAGQAVQTVLATRELGAAGAGAGTQGVSLTRSDVRCHDEPHLWLTSQALIWLTIWPRTVEQDWGNCHSILQEACHGYLNRLPTNSRLKCKWLWSKQTTWKNKLLPPPLLSFSLFTWRLHDFPRVGPPGWWQK